MTKDIIQDREGFIWVGTSNGLNRFDGKNFRIFKQESNNPQSISDSYVNCLFEDSKGTLWVGTVKGGLCRYRNDGIFDIFKHNPNIPTTISNNHIRCIYEDSKGMLWIGTQNGLNKFDTKTEQFESYLPDPNSDISLPQQSVISILEDSHERLWVGTEAGGIALYIPPNTIEGRGEGSFLNINKGKGVQLKSNNIGSLLEDKEGRIWVGVFDGGLHILIPPSDCEEYAHCSPEDFKFIKIEHHNSNGKGSDVILSLLLDASNTLWVGDIYGINKMSLEPFEGKSIQMINEEVEFDYLPFNMIQTVGTTNLNINKIFQDKSGLLWFASTKGIYQYYGHQLKFKIFLNEYTTENELSIISFLEDKDGVHVWLGTSKKDLLRYNKKNGKIDKYSFSTSNGQVLGFASSLFEDKSGTLWVGTWYGELFSIKNRNDTPEYDYHPLPELSKLDAIDVIWKIIQDKKGNLWICSHSGLIRYDIATKQDVSFFSDLANPNSLHGENVFDIIEDKNGIFWIATGGGGLNRLDWKSDKNFTFTHYETDPQNPNSINSNFLYDIELIGNSIWAGLQSGIQEYNMEQDSFYQNRTLNDDISGEILGITLDNQKRVWFTTNDGLYSYDPTKDVLSQYYRKQGLVNNFEFRGIYSAPNGKMYFGGIDGFNSFHGSDIIEDTFSNILQITDFKIANKSVIVGVKDKDLSKPILTRCINHTKEIMLSYKHQLITFEYAVLDFMSFEHYEYAYQLEGFDDDCMNIGERNSVTYTNLAPNTYTFKVKAKNNAGVWSQPTVLKINIKPPIWQTWWFILLMVLAVWLGLFLIQSRREIFIRRRNDELEQKIKERTKELNKNITQLQEKEVILEEKNNELKRYIASNSDLENFAYIAAHDLRTPLANIMGLTEILKMSIDQKLNEEELEILEHINFSAANMKRLTEDLLTYSRVNTQKQNIEVVELKKLLELLLQELNISIEVKDATIELHNIPELIRGDYSQIRQLFQNLISNAIKFAGSKSPPKVIITAKFEKDNWLFAVKDNGIGISEVSLKKIFLLFEKLHNNSEYEGTGIGLAMCKTIVERHDGKIWVHSKPHEGSTFYFTISKNL
ncbi:MAG: two-component regulator propeller domain-containing protein [Chitinophagales bacterium]